MKTVKRKLSIIITLSLVLTSFIPVQAEQVFSEYPILMSSGKSQQPDNEFYFQAEEDAVKVCIYDNTYSLDPEDSILKYYVDSLNAAGGEWKEYYFGDEIELPCTDDRVYFAASKDNSVYDTEFTGMFDFNSTGKVSIGGDITTLINKEGNADIPDHFFASPFMNMREMLIDASDLIIPDVQLGDHSCAGMFAGCSNLEYAPELLSKQLAPYCYFNMFKGCSALMEMPELPATVLSEGCYNNMFSNCSSLFSTTELPATELAEYCYYAMFAFCDILTTAPFLPAEDLKTGCYDMMFYGCQWLNLVKTGFTSWKGGDGTDFWMEGVSEEGTFICSANLDSIATGSNGIPEGWNHKNWYKIDVNVNNPYLGTVTIYDMYPTEGVFVMFDVIPEPGATVESVTMATPSSAPIELDAEYPMFVMPSYNVTIDVCFGGHIIEAVPKFSELVLPTPQELTLTVDGNPAAPEDVEWYQYDGNGDMIEETIYKGNPLILPATVPMDAGTWYAWVSIDGSYEEYEFIKPWETLYPEGMAVIFNNQPIYPGDVYDEDDGYIELSEDGYSLLVKDVEMNDFEQILDIPAELIIFGYYPDEYEIKFEGNCDFGYTESPEDPEKYYSILGLFGGGSDVTVRGEEGAVIDARSVNFQEIRTADYMDKITSFHFENFDLKSHTYSYESFMINATKVYFEDCDMDLGIEDYPGAFVIGINNYNHEEDDEITEWKNCNLKVVNNYQEIPLGGISLGMAAPSAYNDNHANIIFKDCSTDLLLDHMTQGECRGVYAMSADLVIDGGNFTSKAVCQAGDDSSAVSLGAALQAPDVTIKNDANVTLYSNSPIDSWGIIYSYNVSVEDSRLNISVEGGSNSQGIYFFGSSKKQDVGKVSFRNSDAVIDVSGTSSEYIVGGISSRALLADNSDVLIKVTDSKGEYAVAVLVYDFNDTGKITLIDEDIDFPYISDIKRTSIDSIFTVKFYTIVDWSEKMASTVHFIPREADDPNGQNDDSANLFEKPHFTGNRNNPVSDGLWIQRSDGSWLYKTNAMFRSTWGYIINPYAGNKADWFYFDASGNMLTGWQWIRDIDGIIRCYYLNPLSDGRKGACLLGPAVSPDGYTVDENGAWIVDGIVQVRNK